MTAATWHHAGFSDLKDAEAVKAEIVASGGIVVRRHDATSVSDGSKWCVLTVYHGGRVWQVVEIASGARERQRLRGRSLDRWSVRTIGNVTDAWLAAQTDEIRAAIAQAEGRA